MAITTADAGSGQNPTSDTTYELFFDIDSGGRFCLGLLLWSATEDVEVYFDTIATSAAPITIVAGAEPVLIADITSGIRKGYVRGDATAEFSWAVSLR